MSVNKIEQINRLKNKQCFFRRSKREQIYWIHMNSKKINNAAFKFDVERTRQVRFAMRKNQLNSAKNSAN